MKQVLVIDESPLFREYVKNKLVAEKISVETAINHREGAKKMFSSLPDLVIMDASMPYDELLAFLKQKNQSPNSVRIPLILSGPQLPKEKIAQLALFNVVRYINKPIKVDLFFENIGKRLGVSIPIDTTQGIIETHVSGNILFVEVSQGLNREKISLLHYRLAELIAQNDIANPKVVVMISNLQLCFIDGSNLELLFNSILADYRIRAKNVKVLTLDPFVKDLIKGHNEYELIETADNVAELLPSIVPPNSTGTDITEQITNHILNAEKENVVGSVQMRLSSDNENASVEEMYESTIRIAIVDDDAVTRTMLAKAFAPINTRVVGFETGDAFLEEMPKAEFDLVILDIFMPGTNGFDILIKLRNAQFAGQVIVYTSFSKREAVIQALSLGAASYLIKPLRPEQIVQKSIEVLNQPKA